MKTKIMTKAQCTGYGVLALQEAMNLCDTVFLTPEQEKALLFEFSRQLGYEFEIKRPEKAAEEALALLSE